MKMYFHFQNMNYMINCLFELFDDDFKILFFKSFISILSIDIPITLLISLIEYYEKPRIIMKYKIPISRKKVVNMH